MESATDALDFDLYVEEKKREAVSVYFRLVALTDKTALGIVKQVGNQDGFEAYRRLAIRCTPRTLGQRLSSTTTLGPMSHRCWIRLPNGKGKSRSTSASQ
eukprot:1807106-Amphidinium_carterae.1